MTEIVFHPPVIPNYQFLSWASANCDLVAYLALWILINMQEMRNIGHEPDRQWFCAENAESLTLYCMTRWTGYLLLCIDLLRVKWHLLHERFHEKIGKKSNVAKFNHVHVWRSWGCGKHGTRADFSLTSLFWLPWQPKISHIWAKIIKISPKNQLLPISTIFTWFVPRDS